MPAGSKILLLRSNIPAILRILPQGLTRHSPRAQKRQAESIIVVKPTGNHGQGSSARACGAAPLYLGVRAVIAVVVCTHTQKQPYKYGHHTVYICQSIRQKGGYISREDFLIIDNLSEKNKRGRSDNA